MRALGALEKCGIEVGILNFDNAWIKRGRLHSRILLGQIRQTGIKSTKQVKAKGHREQRSYE